MAARGAGRGRGRGFYFYYWLQLVEIPCKEVTALTDRSMEFDFQGTDDLERGPHIHETAYPRIGLVDERREKSVMERACTGAGPWRPGLKAWVW